MLFDRKHGIAALLRSGGGAVVVTGSPTGLYGFAARETAYSASKAGCHGLARVCATEYAKLFAWLVSDDASYVTGGFSMADGGPTSV